MDRKAAIRLSVARIIFHDEAPLSELRPELMSAFARRAATLEAAQYSQISTSIIQLCLLLPLGNNSKLSSELC